MRKMKSKKKKNKNIRSRKAPFFVLADKLLENLKEINKIKECTNCGNVIEHPTKICHKCGSEIKNKLNYEENMEYIRAYIQDKIYTQNEIIQGLSRKLSEYKKIIEENELEDLFGMEKKREPVSVLEKPTDITPSMFPFNLRNSIDDQRFRERMLEKYGKKNKEILDVSELNDLTKEEQEE